MRVCKHGAVLLNNSESEMEFAKFDGSFESAKMVFLQLFFDFTKGSGPADKLRYLIFDDVMDCVRYHWESRLDLHCRKEQTLFSIDVCS